MRKLAAFMLVIFVILNLAAPGYCDGPIKKLGRGVLNVITCPLEIPNRIGETNRRSGFWDGATYGFLEGICMMIGRGCAGAYEILTFPVPIPEKYGPILRDPEYFWPASSKK